MFAGRKGNVVRIDIDGGSSSKVRDFLGGDVNGRRRKRILIDFLRSRSRREKDEHPSRDRRGELWSNGYAEEQMLRLLRKGGKRAQDKC